MNANDSGLSQDEARALNARRGKWVLAASLAGILALLATASVAALGWMAVDAWARRDADLQISLVFRAIGDELAAAPPKDEAEIAALLQKLGEDNRLASLAFCSPQGDWRDVVGAAPRGLDCANLPMRQTRLYEWVGPDGEKLPLSVFRLPDGARLIAAPDTEAVGRQAGELRLYAALILLCATIAFVFLNISQVVNLRRRWAQSLRAAIEQNKRGGARRVIEQIDLPAKEEISALLTELRVERKFAKGIHVRWSPESLRVLLREELPDAQVMTVSNREPFIHNRVDGEIQLQTPASGLVSALEPVMRACGGVWIAHGGGSADREACDAAGRLQVPPDNPSYWLRRVWLSDEEQDGYYYGLANEGLWPLCHLAFVRPNFREQDWRCYKEVNARFAAAVAEEATDDSPVVLVQDYHFALAPRMIRKRLPKATIVTFWHIPWPNAETFGVCPWREEIVDGLLGSSILGFHTQFHCNNFFDTVDRFVESRVDRENFSVALQGLQTLVRPYPISIEWPPRALTGQPTVEECRAVARKRFDLGENVRIAVGVERFDYTKGILDRMRAVDDLLTLFPEWRGAFTLIQVAAPTRDKLEAYAALRRDAESLAAEINAKYADCGCPPIRLVIRHHEPQEVYQLFRAADVCIVSSLHDGMNLVAKEFVAARNDRRGVLVLSSFAGAACELPEALIVNPFDAHGMAKVLDRALRMTVEEQAERMRIMAAQISERNVYRWAAQMLIDAGWLRRRERVGSARA